MISLGTTVSALDEEWVPGMGQLRESLLCPVATVATSSHSTIPDLSHLRVADLIIQSQFEKTWNVALLHGLWPEFIVQAIVALPLGHQDIRCWQDEPGGTCRLRSLYKQLLPRTVGPSLPWEVVSKFDVPPKLRIFYWRLLHDRLPTRSRLSRWSAHVDPKCPLCNQADEIVDHIFHSCPFTQPVWALFSPSFQPPTRIVNVAFWLWQVATPKNQKLGIVIFWWL